MIPLATVHKMLATGAVAKDLFFLIFLQDPDSGLLNALQARLEVRCYSFGSV